MSGECEKCGEHCLECECDKTKLTIDEICISEEIQCELATIITMYLNNKRPLIDALEWILTVIVNDHRNGLNLYKNLWASMAEEDDPFYSLYTEFGLVEGEEGMQPGYICRYCAFKLNATAPTYHSATWHYGTCDFCNEEGNLCHTSDWDWTDQRHLEEDREY